MPIAPCTTLTVRVADRTQTLMAEGRRCQLVLSALLRQAGVSLNTRCGQHGLCDGCLVDLLSGRLIDAGTGVALPATGQTHTVRACQYHLPPDGSVEIHVPGRSLLAHEPQVVTAFRINVSRAHDPLWQRIDLPADDVAVDKPLAEAVCEAVARQRDYDLPVQAARTRAAQILALRRHNFKDRRRGCPSFWSKPAITGWFGLPRPLTRRRRSASPWTSVRRRWSPCWSTWLRGKSSIRRRP